MLMIQTYQPTRPRAGSGASGLGGALPLLRCMQPCTREGSQSPTTPRHVPTTAGLGHNLAARGQDEYVGAHSCAREHEHPRTSRPTSYHAQRGSLMLPRALTPWTQPSALDAPGGHPARLAEQGRLWGPEPAAHPLLVTTRLLRAQLDDAWRAAVPSWAALSRDELLARVYRLSQAKSALLAGRPVGQQVALEEIIRATARELEFPRLHHLAARLDRDALASGQAVAALAAELVHELVRLSEDEFEEREMPAAKRRHLADAPYAEPADEMRRSQHENQAEIRNEVRRLERMMQLTTLLAPPAALGLA